MAILDKKQMTEEDIKLNFITPAIMNKGWKDYVTMETKITDGRISLKGNVVTRESPKKPDYILYLNHYNPIAVVEAKDNKRSISFGIQQAKMYAAMLNVKFAYSSNGDGFQEFDFLTGIERKISLEEFPTYDELVARYQREINDGNGLNETEIKFINQPYYTSQTTYSPRYYQRNAINKTLDAIAKGQNRILLVMATGTGKTYVAFQIVYRLLQSGAKKKILYLADRNNLIDQTTGGDFKPLEKVIHKINFAKDDRTTITSYQVYFSLYQQLVGNKTEEDEDDEPEEEMVARYSKLFDKDFFDLIIVDECHRGSAKADSRWRKILEYFSSATQIGMTATPKETAYVSNIDYFGEPVYKYSLKEGIDDGFLAPFKVINVKSDISDGWRPVKGQRDYFGNEIEDRIYNNSDYDYNIVIQDRINMVAKEVTDYLKATDRMSKTIVFCATEDAADRMREAILNLNSDMVRKNQDYVLRITGSDEYGKSKLKYFTSVSEKYPVIATTSKLLSTGVDCKMVKLIVIDEMINSMTEFKQIIGRGTRLREQDGKTHFMIMDFRGVTRLFADPDWDGPIEQDDEYPRKKPEKLKGETFFPPMPPKEPRHKYYVDEKGCRVEVIQKVVSIYDIDGKLLKQESIIDYTKANIFGEFATLNDFINTWTAEEKKEKIHDLFLEKGIDLEQIKADENMSNVDDFDFICHIAYNQKPLTRKERAENVKKRNVFAKYGETAREVINALLDKYADSSVYEIEDTDVLKLEPFTKFGKPSKIAQLFGGKEGYLQAIQLLKQELYRTVA